MSLFRASAIRLTMILSIVAIALAALVGSTSPVGAATTHGSSSHAKAAHAKHAKAKKHASKKHKAKKHKSKKKSKKAKRPAAKHVTPAPRKAAAKTAPAATMKASPFAYNRLRHRYTFSGSKVDASAWSVYNTNGPWSTDKDARRPELVTASNNMLHVTASGTKGSGLCLCKKATKPSAPYGRYEIRARAAANVDHGFAMLLWPNAENWPAGGEIDIAEFDTARTKLWTTLHYSPKNKRYIAGTKGDYRQWHTYGVEWTPKSIRYYVDGKTLLLVTDPAAIPHGAMHLALQAGKMEGVKNPSNTTATLDVAWINEYA